MSGDTALFRISKKRFANEKKLLSDPEKAPYYVTAFPSDTPGEELVWYFLLMGDDDSSYKGGEYIGKIMHNKNYPAKPPDYMMLTPNGRYSINNKICLSNSSYHAGEWSSSWNIITILIAFVSIWYDDKEHGISHIKDTDENRKKMAENSIEFNMKNYSEIYKKFDRTFLSGSDPKIKAKIILPPPSEDKEDEKIKENNELLDEINNIATKISDNKEDNVKDDIKDNVKDDIKDNVKDDIKDNVKDDIKDNVKDDIKDNNDEKDNNIIKVKKSRKKRIVK
jgi:ubiquitin-protein ligase